MAYEQNKIEFNPPTGPLHGTEYSEQIVAMIKRVVTNALGTEQPIDLYDGEFFLRDNDPQPNERTLYLNYKGALKKFAKINSDGTVDISSSEVDLSLYLKKDEASSTYATKTELSDGLATKQDAGEYVTGETLTQELAKKQDTGDYATNTALTDGLALKQDKGNYVTSENLTLELEKKQDKGEYITNQQLTEGLAGKQDTGNYFNKDTDKINLISQVEDKLPVENGGTGTVDGFNFQNTMQVEDFFKNIEASKNITTQNFIDKILAKYDNKPFMVCVVNVSNAYINDLPSDAQVSNRIIIIQEDRNQLNLILYKHYDLVKYEGCVYNNTFKGWTKLRNADGTIPFGIGGVIKKYSNAAGMWTETLLDTGEILLEGYSINTTLINGTATVTLPKTVKYSAGCSPTYTTAQTQQLYTTFTTTNFTIKGASNAVITWHYTGILA